MHFFKKYHPYFIWGLAACFFLSEYFARVAPSIMVPDLMRAFDVGAFSLGALSAFFYYPYVAMQIPVGTLVDRFGAHRLLTIMAAICGFSCFIFASSHYLEAAKLARFLMGFSAAFAFVGALKLAHVWFPPHRFGFLAGTTQALGMLGAAIGEGPVAVLVAHIGWQHTMYLIGAVLLFIAILIGLIVRDQPRKTPTQSFGNTHQSHSLWQSFSQVIRNPQTWVNGIIVGFLYAPTAAFAELWGTSYLRVVYNLRNEVAAAAISMIFIGWAVGGPLGGWFSDYIRKRKPIILASAILGLIFLGLVLYAPGLPVWLVFVLLFCYGVSNVGVATCYAAASEINARPLAGTSMGFSNMASVIIGAGFQPIIGRILDKLWDGKIINGVHHYTAADYRVAMIALPVCFVISLMAWPFLKESFGNNYDL